MPTIPKVWLYVGAAALAGLLMLAVAWTYNKAFNEGKAAGIAEVKAEVSAKAAADLAISQMEIVNVTKKLQTVEDQINAAPLGDDGPLSPVLRDQLARMRGSAALKGGSARNESPRPFHP